MTNYIDHLAAVHQILMEDDTLKALVNDQIHTGINPAMLADSYLAQANHSCVLLQSISKNSRGLPGVAYHENSKHDQLIRFTVISKSDSDTYAAEIAGRIEDLIKVAPSKTLNGVQYQILPAGISMRTQTLDPFPDRVYVIGDFRIRYYG